MGFSRQEYWSGVPLPSPLVAVRQSYSLVVVRGPLIVVASLAAEHGLRALGLSSCSAWAQLLFQTFCGIFLDQGSSPYSLHWQVDS